MSPISEATVAERRLENVMDTIADATLERDELMLELRDQHDRSLRQIADLAGMSHGGVAWVLERARRRRAKVS